LFLTKGFLHKLSEVNLFLPSSILAI
jgi:hypothetical protein